MLLSSTAHCPTWQLSKSLIRTPLRVHPDLNNRGSLFQARGTNFLTRLCLDQGGEEERPRKGIRLRMESKDGGVIGEGRLRGAV